MQTLGGDTSWLPTVQVVDQSVLNDLSGTQGPGVGLAAYDASNDTILLSQDLLDGDADTALALYTEEMGHALDARLNTTDAAGDEGAIFAALFAGESLDEAQLAALHAEDDSGVLLVDGELVEVEFGFFSDIGNALSSFGGAVVDTVSAIGSGVGNVVTSAAGAVAGTVNSVGELFSDGVQAAGDFSGRRRGFFQ